MRDPVYRRGMGEVRERTLSTTRIAVGVTVGILVAAALIFTVWKASQPSEFDCAVQRTDYELGNIQAHEVDDACR